MSLKQKITYKQFAKAKLKWDSLGGNVISIPKEKSTYKPKPWVCPELLLKYWVERDIVLYLNGDKEIADRYSGNFKGEFDNRPEYRQMFFDGINNGEKRSDGTL